MKRLKNEKINSDMYWLLHFRLNNNVNTKQLRKQLGEEE